MSYKYTHFIKQNIAPNGAENIAVYNENGEKIYSIPLGRMAKPTKQKLYSFGLVSDTHLYKTQPTWQANTKFDNALTYFENQGCVFCAISGDVTDTGFYNYGDNVNFEVGYFAKYKEICDKHNIPVYMLCGNHESYEVNIENNLTELKAYTGCDLYYTVAQGNDLFIFVGQAKETIPMSDEALQWLYTTLETNRNKRCFVFVHPDISSGNPLGVYATNRLFQNWKHFSLFKRLLNHYKNTVLFHGHSHTKFECQELDENANYSTIDGFKSVHIPSLGRPRNVINGALSNADSESQGYIVDAYDGCIVLNGINLIDNEYIPLGTFKIDTTLQTIEANTFTDSTGVIK
jgi:predicted phosphodiesterase